MKIIGKTTTGFLVEITGQEVCRLAGANYERSDGAPNLGLGSVININSMWDHYHKMRNQPTVMQSAAESLRAAATVLEAMPDITTEEDA
jgi:Iap family predicted aminopeptidase